MSPAPPPPPVSAAILSQGPHDPPRPSHHHRRRHSFPGQPVGLPLSFGHPSANGATQYPAPPYPDPLPLSRIGAMPVTSAAAAAPPAASAAAAAAPAVAPVAPLSVAQRAVAGVGPGKGVPSRPSSAHPMVDADIAAQAVPLPAPKASAGRATALSASQRPPWAATPPLHDGTTARPPPRVQVTCQVRTRITTETNGTAYIYLYTNNQNAGEDLAVVYEPSPESDDDGGDDDDDESVPIFTSQSLVAHRVPGETDRERAIRGAPPLRRFTRTVPSGAGIWGSNLSFRRAAPAAPSVRSPNTSDAAASPSHGATAPEHRQAAAATTDTANEKSAAAAADHDDDDDASDCDAPLVRIHSSCFTGETLRSCRCDCNAQLQTSMALLARQQQQHQQARRERREQRGRRPSEAAATTPEAPLASGKRNRTSRRATDATGAPARRTRRGQGGGVVLYLQQEGRGIGLREKLRAYNLIDMGYDTLTANLVLGHPADARVYDVAVAILRDLGVDRIRLLTNNADKVRQLESGGVRVVQRIGMVPKYWFPDAPATTANLAGGDAGGDADGPADGDTIPAAAAATAHHRRALSSDLVSDPKDPITLSVHANPPTVAAPVAAAPSMAGVSRRGGELLVTMATPGNVRTPDRDYYLWTKAQRMQHLLPIPSYLAQSGMARDRLTSAQHAGDDDGPHASSTPP
ncbi:hypothetical protein CXG81DRAFT_19062 [Caulochytrium protostelioides]|uniref:GTP cyclohydrolase II domain-containing protein n=1 Tax=Caulochytrium protostelioides TaxID=1555241 RepID=A0A4P9X7A1_9FUNG|nr:hypothetical protein CXG81DRAFT_19062 [Caulochytrium protostelioides]|eukprot:RKP01106.1 hypothetical protein CXG81DRAFT_19062 [Caulochytrium protostelioides]